MPEENKFKKVPSILYYMITSRLSPPYGGGEEIVINHVRAVKTVLDIFGILNVTRVGGPMYTRASQLWYSIILSNI